MKTTHKLKHKNHRLKRWLYPIMCGKRGKKGAKKIYMYIFLPILAFLFLFKTLILSDSIPTIYIDIDVNQHSTGKA